MAEWEQDRRSFLENVAVTGAAAAGIGTASADNTASTESPNTTITLEGSVDPNPNYSSGGFRPETATTGNMRFFGFSTTPSRINKVYVFTPVDFVSVS